MRLKELSDTRRKLEILNNAKEIGNSAAACCHLGISGETFQNVSALMCAAASAD